MHIPLPGKVTGAAWGPAQVLCTLVAFQHYPHIWTGSVPAQPDDGTVVPPYLCPCRFDRPTGPLERGEVASDASGRTAGKIGLTWAGKHDLAPSFLKLRESFFLKKKKKNPPHTPF